MRLAGADRTAADRYAAALQQLALAAAAGAERVRSPTGDPIGLAGEVGAALAGAYRGATAARDRFLHPDGAGQPGAGHGPAPAVAGTGQRLPPVADDELPRLFALWRHRDPTGQSGTGIVLFGVAFPGGPVLTRWRGLTTGIYQLGLWNNVEEVLAVHGHHGATELVWLTDPADRRDPLSGS
ncbi:hypothetical protein Athai_29930 [Actinocatenispora thailandica]|uniref:Uncharacterized protein n=1 Tax=Actinocatenispora thailandica TaxID=227318 RepID=A0A7R7DPI0_9ACTN|nr:hypothetical protein [Actinocatenispora thailandica]BCJ35490.1 hypothetical protein Athai_29930 [Actinocatenispora thailandica]